MFLFKRETLCKKIQGMLSEYMDNRLGSEDRVLVESHLEACEACSSELESLRMAVQLLHRVPLVSVPRSFTIAVPEPRREGVLGASSLRWLRPATAVATVVLVVLLAVDFLNIAGSAPGGGDLLNEPPSRTFSTFVSEGAGNDTGVLTDVAPQATPEPTPGDGEKVLVAGNQTAGNETAGNETAGNETDMFAPAALPPGGEAAAGQEAGGLPLRQIEIAMGAVLFALVAMTVFVLRQRKSAVRVK
jgi:hypothetical protein